MPILFDLDDTLLDDRGAQNASLAQFFDGYRNELPYASQAAFGAAWRLGIERHFERYLRGEVSVEEQRRARIRDVFGQPDMDTARTDAIIADFLGSYSAAWRLLPDVLQTLNALQGTTLGVITNGNQAQQVQKLRATGIQDRFSIIIVSEAVGHAKPSREIFEHACSRLGRPALDCVFVGDDWKRDVVGCSAVQMLPIWVNPTEKITERDGVLTIASLAELTERTDVRSAIARAREPG